MDAHKTILCVDDEPNILQSLERILRVGKKYRILTAASGREGLEILAREPVDLVVSDQRMPGMSGSEFLGKVKQQYPQVIRILFSGYSDFHELVSAINEGAIYRFVSKPCDSEMLRQTIATALEQTPMVAALEALVRKTCAVLGYAGRLSVRTAGDQTSVEVQFQQPDGELTEREMLDMVEKLYLALNRVEDGGLKFATGVIQKANHLLTLTLNIGPGLCLKIESPYIQRNEGATEPEKKKGES